MDNESREVWIKRRKEPDEMDLESPILIEGLPGMGMIGKLTVDQMKSQLETEKYADIHSKHFHPHVDLGEDHVVNLRRNELHVHRRERGKEDLVFLTGPEQGVSFQGQYMMSEKIIEEAESLGVKNIYTLGGYATKAMKDDPKVFGAVTHTDMRKEYEEEGVKFEKKGPIGGAAGLLLGFGKDKQMKGVCLMGETHGRVIDPNAAKKVLSLVEKLLDFEIDHSELEEKAEEVKESIEEAKKTQQTQQQQAQGTGVAPSDSPMEYIQ